MSLIGKDYISKVDAALLPTPEEAAREYENAGGRLTIFNEFGIDPLHDHNHLIQQREYEFFSQFCFDNIFHNLVNGKSEPFVEGLLLFISISDRLAQQVTN